MTYEEFVAEYGRLMIALFEYRSDEAGHLIYCEKLGKLCDDHPEFTKRYESYT